LNVFIVLCLIVLLIALLQMRNKAAGCTRGRNSPYEAGIEFKEESNLRTDEENWTDNIVEDCNADAGELPFGSNSFRLDAEELAHWLG
jgi:hypothetical protein